MVLDFDQIQVGDEAGLEHLLTQADVQAFTALTGDTNPLHIKTLSHRPVVHGMLSASFISTVIGTILPGNGSLWVRQTLEFLQPAYIGDTLYVAVQVKQKSLAMRTVLLQTTITNQHGQKLVSGKGVVVC